MTAGLWMFEVAELGNVISKEEYDRALPKLREDLLEAQVRIQEAQVPVVILFAGVDGAGKGELSNLLSWWMDPRLIVTRAYEEPTTEEAERPDFWRFWRDLPPKGHIGVFLKAWYSKPLLLQAYGESTEAEFVGRLDEIAEFEKTLAADGALVLKFWMHLGREQQERRLRTLEADPLTAWRVKPEDWKHWEMYDRFVEAASNLIARTSAPEARWHIIEGTDPHYRGLEVGNRILREVDNGLRARAALLEARKANGKKEEGEHPLGPTVLSTLDLSKTLAKSEYETRLTEVTARLNQLHRTARSAKKTTVLVMEGMDAAGKGGAIRRLTAALDARSSQVVSIGPPTNEEDAQHYLWRFWRLLPRAGRVIIFDRSWYGRVLVERVEGFAEPDEWERAYREINAFERQLVDDYAIVGKFWLQVSDEEQARRFESRAAVPYKRWKLTEEDWRNRKRRPAYERAVHDMVARTSTPSAPWILIAGEDKRWARVRVLEEVCRLLEGALFGAEDDSDE